jgi:hypothetical protein
MYSCRCSVPLCVFLQINVLNNLSANTVVFFSYETWQSL